MGGFGFWISILALIISLYAAVSARRSASAAERSAQAAEEAIAFEQQNLRETWIAKIQHALPDGDQVTSLLADLPDALRPDWQQLIKSAAQRNARTPPKRIEILWQRYESQWSGTVNQQ